VLPDTPAHDRRELELLAILGPVLIAAKGDAAQEVEAIGARTHKLRRRVRNENDKC